MSLTRREWNAAILLGCLVGTGIVILFWIAVLALAQLNHLMPGAGWVAATVLVCGTTYEVWHLERATHPRMNAKGARDVQGTD